MLIEGKVLQYADSLRLPKECALQRRVEVVHSQNPSTPFGQRHERRIAPACCWAWFRVGRQRRSSKSLLSVLTTDSTFSSCLTKGTKALTTQTTERLKQAFDTIIEDDDLRVFDVMALPEAHPV